MFSPSRFVCLCWGLTSKSTIFQSCRDGATASWVINQYFRGVKCLAQGHNTAAVGLEPPTSRSGVRHSTTEPPHSPHLVDKCSSSPGNYIWSQHTRMTKQENGRVLSKILCQPLINGLFCNAVKETRFWKFEHTIYAFDWGILTVPFGCIQIFPYSVKFEITRHVQVHVKLLSKIESTGDVNIETDYQIIQTVLKSRVCNLNGCAMLPALTVPTAGNNRCLTYFIGCWLSLEKQKKNANATNRSGQVILAPSWPW